MHCLTTLILFVLFAAQTAVPNLSGRWKLDLDASSAATPVPGATQLVVYQGEDDVQFQYEKADGSLLAEDRFSTDWRSERRFATRIQIGYARARWEGKQLLIETKVVMNVEGTQSYSYDERWSLSPDGKTLTQKSSDGKKLVYDRMPEQPGER